MLELVFTSTLLLQKSIPTRASTIFQNQQSLSLNENKIVSDKILRNEKGMKMKMIIKDLLSQIHFIATAVFIPFVNSFSSASFFCQVHSLNVAEIVNNISLSLLDTFFICCVLQSFSSSIVPFYISSRITHQIMPTVLPTVFYLSLFLFLSLSSIY